MYFEFVLDNLEVHLIEPYSWANLPFCKNFNYFEDFPFGFSFSLFLHYLTALLFFVLKLFLFLDNFQVSLKRHHSSSKPGEATVTPPPSIQVAKTFPKTPPFRITLRHLFLADQQNFSKGAFGANITNFGEGARAEKT